LVGQLFGSDADPEKPAIRTPRADARIGATFKSRGDKTAIEFFVVEVRGWEAGLRRFLSHRQMGNDHTNVRNERRDAAGDDFGLDE
jgi:hypothetical protein